MSRRRYSMPFAIQPRDSKLPYLCLSVTDVRTRNNLFSFRGTPDCERFSSFLEVPTTMAIILLFISR